MSAVKSGSSLGALVLTPERIPSFFIPSRSPRLFLSPGPQRGSEDRISLLSDHDDTGPPETPPSPTSRFLLRLPSPRIRRPCGVPLPAVPAAAESSDVDVTTRAALSLPHVAKVTTPYGFRAVLAASPCTRRRESLFHQRKPTTNHQDPGQQGSGEPPPRPPPPRSGPRRSRVSPWPIRPPKVPRRPAATENT